MQLLWQPLAILPHTQHQRLRKACFRKEDKLYELDLFLLHLAMSIIASPYHIVAAVVNP